MDASATGWLEWCTAVCSLVLIAISLFLFITFVNVVRSSRCVFQVDKSSACWLGPSKL